MKTFLLIFLLFYSSLILADAVIKNNDGTVTVDRNDGTKAIYSNYDEFLKKEPTSRPSNRVAPADVGDSKDGFYYNK